MEATSEKKKLWVCNHPIQIDSNPIEETKRQPQNIEVKTSIYIYKLIEPNEKYIFFKYNPKRIKLSKNKTK